MKTIRLIIRIIFRIISVPFIMALIFLTTLKFIVLFMVDYVRYGGEFIAYKEDHILIKDVFEEVRKLVKK